MSQDKMLVWTFWDGPKSALVSLCLETIQRHHPERFRCLSSEDVLQLGGSEPLKLSEGHVIQYRSDLVRFWLMREFGGLWFDADTLALRPSILLDDMASQDMAAFAGDMWPDGAALHFGMRAGDLAAKAYEQCKSLFSGPFDYAETSIGVIGHLTRNYRTTHRIKIRQHYNFAKIAWRNPGRIFGTRSDIRFERDRKLWNPDASTYYLSWYVAQATRLLSRQQLLESRTFLGFLFRKALGLAPLES